MRDLLERLGANRGVLLYGPPGAGRTSLIDAGLVPAALAQGVEVLSVRLRPQRGRELVVAEQPSGAERELSPDELRARLADSRALVILDDFDDVVTLLEGSAPLRAAQARIVALLRDLLAAERVGLLLSFREERLARVLVLDDWERHGVGRGELERARRAAGGQHLLALPRLRLLQHRLRLRGEALDARHGAAVGAARPPRRARRAGGLRGHPDRPRRRPRGRGAGSS